MNKKLIMILILLICIGNIHAQDARTSNTQETGTSNTQDTKTSNAKDTESSNDLGITITHTEIEYFIISDFNRTFNYLGGFSLSGLIEFNHRVTVKEGVYLNCLPEDVNMIKIFTNATYRILKDWPLDAKLAWTYNGLPDYETHSHTIAPIISWNEKYYGISVGYGFRFTYFFGEGPEIEHILPVGIYVNFINDKKICVGMSLANYSDFQMDSFIAFALAAKVTLNIEDGFSIINEFELRQSGADGLTNIVYGVIWKGGVKLSW